jgi:hypothetical protein
MAGNDQFELLHMYPFRRRKCLPQRSFSDGPAGLPDGNTFPYEVL